MASDSLRIGSIWGINVSLHWIFILFMLFFFLVSPFGFLILMLLFICVFIHEAAHSYTALRNKISVKEIILTPIGGASVIDDINIDPRTEFNVALVGPIMSLFLGGLFGILVIFTPPGLLTSIIQILFLLNISLGILNVLPALPLDGGRVFRGYLRKKYDELTATAIAVKATKYMAVLFVLAPIAYFLLVPGYSEVYIAYVLVIFAFMAFYIYISSQAELQSVVLKKDTKGLTVQKAVTKEYLLVKKDTNTRDLYKLVEKKGVPIVIVKKNDSYMLVDLFRRRIPKVTNAGDLAISIPQLSPTLSVMEAMQKLEGDGKGVGIVIRNGKVLGIVTMQHLNALISLHVLSKEGRQQ